MRIYLLDTLYHVFRAFHALPPLKAPDGTPTNAVHGVLGILGNLWRQERIDGLVAVFESRERGFREELNPEYKATRPVVDPDLSCQIPLVRELCESLGIPTLSVEGFEADDVMATLARRITEHGHTAVVVSNDKDLAQVLHLGDVELLRLSGSGKKARLERVRSEQVEGLFGVGPTLIPSWLALCGDSVDNLRGVDGIGSKTASKLLNEHGSLTALLEKPELAGRFGPCLTQEKTRLLRDLDLATVRDSLDLGFDGFPLEQVRPRPIRGAGELFLRLGMYRHLHQLESLLDPEPTIADLWGV